MHGHSGSLFDHAAESYDAAFSHSPIGALQRKRVWRYLSPILQQRHQLSILEINCGTGIDAVKMSHMGHSVLATDISSKMIAVATDKIKVSEERVDFQVMDINKLDELIGGRTFDLVFSNFGGLNCLSPDQLKILRENLKQLLRPQGRFIAVVMPAYPLMEVIQLIVKGKWASIRRKQQPLMVNVSGTLVKTWYYAPATFFHCFSKAFQLSKTKPIGLFMPPSYMDAWVRRHALLFKGFVWLERIFAVSAWQAPFSDHFYIEMKRK